MCAWSALAVKQPRPLPLNQQIDFPNERGKSETGPEHGRNIWMGANEHDEIFSLRALRARREDFSLRTLRGQFFLAPHHAQCRLGPHDTTQFTHVRRISSVRAPPPARSRVDAVRCPDDWSMAALGHASSCSWMRLARRVSDEGRQQIYLMSCASRGSLSISRFQGRTSAELQAAQSDGGDCVLRPRCHCGDGRSELRSSCDRHRSDST